MLQPLFDNTLANVLAAILMLIIGVVLGWVSRILVERRPVRQLLKLPETNGAIIVIATPYFVIPGTTNISKEDGVPLTPLGPVFAFKSITNLISIAYPQLPNSKLYFASDFPEEQLDRNLFLIGFPKANKITRTVMNDLDLPLIFDNHTLINSDTKKPVYDAVIEDNVVVEDFGCLIRAPSPYKEGSVVFIFAGCQTYGVKAAADFLAAENLLELTGRKTSKFAKRFLSKFPFLITPSESDYYQIIVSTKVKKHFISQPRMVAYYKLKPTKKKKPKKVI
jgi:hypothetical protein